MKSLQKEFEYYVQTQQYVKADILVENLLLYKPLIKHSERSDILPFLYRIGFVYPDLTLRICCLRNDIPKPFIDTLRIEIGSPPFLRLYKYSDRLVAIKIALIRKYYFIANYLIEQFYKDYDLIPIHIMNNKQLTIGNNKLNIIKKKQI